MKAYTQAMYLLESAETGADEGALSYLCKLCSCGCDRIRSITFPRKTPKRNEITAMASSETMAVCYSVETAAKRDRESEGQCPSGGAWGLRPQRFLRLYSFTIPASTSFCRLMRMPSLACTQVRPPWK